MKKIILATAAFALIANADKRTIGVNYGYVDTHLAGLDIKYEAGPFGISAGTSGGYIERDTTYKIATPYDTIVQPTDIVNNRMLFDLSAYYNIWKIQASLSYIWLSDYYYYSTSSNLNGNVAWTNNYSGVALGLGKEIVINDNVAIDVSIKGIYVNTKFAIKSSIGLKLMN
jgi:hypothetical protein